jgi:DNA primase
MRHDSTIYRNTILQNKFAPELIEAIRACSALEEVAGEHVQLRRSGVHLIGRCPFHSDKTPSFAVRPGREVFRCHGCGAAGDVFRFIETLHRCTFPEALRFLAVRAGLVELNTFQPSPELTAKVAALKAQRQEQASFERFCNERIEAINQRHRSLARAATNAEACLRSGKLNTCEQEMAWSALERYRLFEASVEREGLCDLDILRAEWSKLHDAA